LSKEVSYGEKELLARIAMGDQAAFARMIREYTRLVYPYLLHWLKNAQRAEELTQDVFMRVWDKRDKLVPVENIGGYLYVISRNMALDELDKQWAKAAAISPDEMNNLLTRSAFTSSTPLELKELSVILDRAINALPPRRKEVFLLSRREGLSYDSIAAQLGVSRSAVRQHIVEALVYLRHYLKEYADIIVSFLPLLLG
jgi:RNA polymerase sigma-70 factor (family 1)